MLEVRLLRLAHQEQRQCEDDDCPGADRLVRLVHDGCDEAVGHVVRRQPREALAPDVHEALSALDADRDRQERRVDDEVGEARQEARGDEDAGADRTGDVDREDRRGRERREREDPDVEEVVMEARAARAPRDRRHGDRERQRCARPDDRGCHERADGADGDRAGLLDLERERLAEAH